MNNRKRQKDTISEDESLRLEGVQFATVEEQRTTTNSPRKNEVAEPKRKRHSIMDCLVMKVKFDASKNSIA